ncbi:MAG: Na/Pi cotransporter family protein [Candidatus Amulumruptor caecigallinarius]|nr:Na/Pi cotransporter family protein [Candidatus Amulumruptor caecigallinarius]MCM1396765.1 Na/Pi cotransporter family protein [Candidatus Amulumruptor caecigallinarius]MCM1454540.1 Na/Pi cotransporter family protein [bacterium]
MNYSILDFLGLLGSVGLFLYGMKVMSEGLQKAAGDRLRNILSAMTRNRFTGLLTGCLITALIQSSSASTVMVVSFVNAGLMSLAQSMAVIMGANVGTTFTAWIIALLGFKVDVSAFALPILAVAVPLLFAKKGRTKSIGEFLVGFALLFMSLAEINVHVPDLQSNPEMFAFLEKYTDMGLGSVFVFLAVGIIITMVLQSSAATFAIVLIMSSKGWIDFPLSCAVVLGSNIGTTITPILASMSGNVAAKRTAMGHLLFNLLGTVWTLCVFYPFVDLTAWVTELIGQGNPEELAGYVSSLETNDPEVYNNLFNTNPPSELQARLAAPQARIAALQLSVSIGLSMFHTLFNLINVTIMIWFTKLYVKIVVWLVPTRKSDEEEFTLKYISGGMINASELGISQAEKEIVVYGQRVARMIAMSRELVHTKEGSEDFTTRFSRLEKYEEISDRMEIEIAQYLNRCAEGRLSNEGKLHIAAMLSIVAEIESIADCCYGAGKIMLRKHEAGAPFTDQIFHNVDMMFDSVQAAMNNMLLLLGDIEHVREADIIKSYNNEREINNLRNQLRGDNINNINTKAYEYQSGIYYMDLVSDLERMGDYIINVVDTIKEQFRNRLVR